LRKGKPSNIILVLFKTYASYLQSNISQNDLLSKKFALQKGVLKMIYKY
jgi:hypothetical protein